MLPSSLQNAQVLPPSTSWPGCCCACWQVLRLSQAAPSIAIQACHLCCLAHHAGWAGLSLVLVVVLALRHTDVIGPGKGQSPAPSNPQEDALFRNITGLEINPPEGAPCQHAAWLPPQQELLHWHDSQAARRSLLEPTLLTLALDAGVCTRLDSIWAMQRLCRGRCPCNHTAPGLPAAPDVLTWQQPQPLPKRDDWMWSL